MGALAIIGAAAAGATIYSQLSSAASQEEAAKKNAELKRQQADELMAREAINEDIMRNQVRIAMKDSAPSQASRGIEGAGIGGQITALNTLQSNLIIAHRDAAYKANLLRQGADVENKLASDQMSAAYISGVGTLLTAGAKTYQAIDEGAPPSKADKLYSGKKS